MRILVVEDEHRIANAIKKGLQQESYAVDVAYTGSDGYDLAVTEDYDLLILDLMLPGMDGLTLCRKLRDQNRHTPVLILTARSQVKDKVTGLDTGADDYLTKPFSFAELVARVRALSRRPPVTAGPVLTVGDISLDTLQFSLTRAGVKIPLSQKEFSLMQYLLQNAGKILSKDQIISHVWDYDADILPNTVEVYIRNLRNKIDRPFPKLTPHLHTARGFGYKIS